MNWGGNYTFTDWAANGDITPTLISLPSTYGWKCVNSSTHAEETGVFNNYGTQANCRYNDKISGGGYSYNGTEWTGRLLFIRWDGGGLTSRVFSYPVYLGTGTYQINGKAAYNAGAAGSLTFNVNAANDNSGTNYAISTVVTSGVGVLMDIKLINITITTPGVYYFTISSNTASMCAIADLTLSNTALISATAGIGGTVSGAGTYDIGASVSLVATPYGGYKFVNWTENGTEVSTNATFTFTASVDKTYVANFDLNTGIENNNETVSSINVYRNVNGLIAVDCSANAVEQASVLVYNAAGQLLDAKKLTSTKTVLTKTYSPGAYLVNVTYNGKNLIHKVVLK